MFVLCVKLFSEKHTKNISFCTNKYLYLSSSNNKAVSIYAEFPVLSSELIVGRLKDYTRQIKQEFP